MAAEDRTRRLPAGLARAGGFLLLWLTLAGAHAGDLPAALPAAAASWVSLILLPPSGGGLSLFGFARIALRFPGQALAAGVDVARRALSLQMQLSPGFVRFTPRLPPGTARDAFLAYASLLPGTLPAGEDADGALLVHCLDIAQPAGTQMASEEAGFIRALGRPPGHPPGGSPEPSPGPSGGDV